ncbi:MAG: TetR/AcrR family transcriptional regulator [Microthrixaceae bacterium]
MTSTDSRPNQREHILDAALRLMSAHGAAGMSMRALASECGVQVAAIYHYFESKDALLAAVVAERRYGARLADPLALDRDGTPEERLRMLFGLVWEGALAEEEVWRLLLGEGIRGEPAVMPVGRDLLSLLRDATREWVREIVPEVPDPDNTAEILMGQLLSGFVHYVFDSDDVDAGEVARIRADALVRAVFPVEAAAAPG